MVTRFRLRRWQVDGLDTFQSSGLDNLLVVATPGAGKTTYALTCALHHLAAHPSDRIVVVAPTRHLKAQWAQAAVRFGIHLDPTWAAGDGALPHDTHGVIVTYAGLASDPETARRALGAGTFAILDEVHHAGDGLSWGDALAFVLDRCSRRLLLSGTPFRTDATCIPFADYTASGDAVAHVAYPYRAALADRVVRPLRFPTVGGELAWTDRDGNHCEATFDDDLDRDGTSARLRTAVAADGTWLPSVLDAAHDTLMAVRAEQPDAGGLVLCVDQDHARAVAGLLRDRCATRATVAVSDDPDASAKIAAFAAGTDPWLVTVRMVSEGVDIPRLRVGVHATTTVSPLAFAQSVGRFVRHTGTTAETAWVYLPDDPRLKALAALITDTVTGAGYGRTGTGGDDSDQLEAGFDEPDGDGDRDRQSLFAAVASRSTGVTGTLEAGGDGGGQIDLGFELELPAAPPVGGGLVDLPAGATLSEWKRELRSVNAQLVARVVDRHNLAHREVNWKLNQAVGVTRLADATVGQLHQRADWARRWLAGR